MARHEIERQIKEFKPDIIVGFGVVNTYLASKIAKKEGIPFVYYWIDVLHKLIPERGFQPLGKYMDQHSLSSRKVRSKRYSTDCGEMLCSNMHPGS